MPDFFSLVLYLKAMETNVEEEEKGEEEEEEYEEDRR
jgi:hypothetical protein